MIQNVEKNIPNSIYLLTINNGINSFVLIKIENIKSNEAIQIKINKPDNNPDKIETILNCFGFF